MRHVAKRSDRGKMYLVKKIPDGFAAYNVILAVVVGHCGVKKF